MNEERNCGFPVVGPPETMYDHIYGVPAVRAWEASKKGGFLSGCYYIWSQYKHSTPKGY